METYLLKNGLVIDPSNNINKVLDVLLIDGKIAKVHENIEADAKVIDCSGLIVTPGLIDAHVHCFYSAGTPQAWAGDFSLQPDYYNFPSGVTTIVDAGSAGSFNFDHFRATCIERAKSKIFAFLNICDYGMSSRMAEQYPERNLLESFIKCAEKNKDIIKGIKVAHYWNHDFKDIEYAKKVKAELDLPIMVDFGVFNKDRPYDELLMKYLDKGDITTHCYRCAVPWLDENGNIYNYLYKAREKGIIFDLGHGSASFMLRNGVPAMRQGFLPDIFSTDLHAESVNTTAIGLTYVLSKMLAVLPDMSLFELFKRVTIEPAKAMNLDGVGTLSEGADADVAIFSIREGNFGYQDMSGGKITGNKKIECEMTFRNGEIVWDVNARNGIPYEELPPLYGLGEEDLIVPTC